MRTLCRFYAPDPGDDVGSDTSSDPDDDEIRTVAEGVESDSTL